MDRILAQTSKDNNYNFYIAGLFLPVQQRAKLYSVINFCYNLLSFQEKTSDYNLLSIRFKWWYDAIDNNFGKEFCGEDYNNPILVDLAKYCQLSEYPILQDILEKIRKEQNFFTDILLLLDCEDQPLAKLIFDIENIKEYYKKPPIIDNVNYGADEYIGALSSYVANLLDYQIDISNYKDKFSKVMAKIYNYQRKYILKNTDSILKRPVKNMTGLGLLRLLF